MARIQIKNGLTASEKKAQFKKNECAKITLRFSAKGTSNVKITYKIEGSAVTARFCENDTKQDMIERSAPLSKVFFTEVNQEVFICTQDPEKTDEVFLIFAYIEDAENSGNSNGTFMLYGYKIIDN